MPALSLERVDYVSVRKSGLFLSSLIRTTEGFARKILTSMYNVAKEAT